MRTFDLFGPDLEKVDDAMLMVLEGGEWRWLADWRVRDRIDAKSTLIYQWSGLDLSCDKGGCLRLSRIA
jgi:hypothetical protein